MSGAVLDLDMFAREVSWVPVTAFKIDDTYQRQVNRAKVAEIAAHFDIRAAGSLTASRRRNGELVLLDGQHRLEAAKRAGLKTLLTVILTGLTLEQEAALWTRFNVHRAPPRGTDVFKALLTANDPLAHEIASIVAGAGLTLWLGRGSGPSKSICAVGALRQIHKRGADALRATLAVVTAAWPGGGTAAHSAAMLTGINSFLEMYPEADTSRLVEQLRTQDPKALTLMAARTSRALNVSARLAMVHNLWKLYNARRRPTNRLPNRILGKLESLEY